MANDPISISPGNRVVKSAIGLLVVVALSALGVLATPTSGARAQTSDPILVGQGAPLIGESAGDDHGAAIALSADGGSIIMGAPSNDGEILDEIGTETSTGQVRVFDWNSATQSWVQRGSDIDGAQAGDLVGAVVDMSADGQTIIVGVPGTPDLSTHDGYAQILMWNPASDTWDQVGTDLSIPDGRLEQVAISDSAQTVALRNDDEVAVFAYESLTQNWIQRGERLAGHTLGFSGDGDTVATRNGPGLLAVHHWDSASSQWLSRGGPIESTAGNLVVRSVALSADGTALAYGVDAADQVTVMDWDGADWTDRGPSLVSGEEGDGFGRSVALSSSGLDMVVGATRPLSLVNPNPGSVELWTWDSVAAVWSQVGATIRGSGNDALGTRVAISGDGQHIAAGAPQTFVIDGAGYVANFVVTIADGQPPSVGDVNCDGLSNIVDALLVARFSVQLIGGATTCAEVGDGTAIVLASADVDDSGTVDIIDALLIARCSVGLC